LILASGSPQRKRLLEEAGYTFRCVVPSQEAECGICSGESPAELVARLARQKAQDVAGQLLASAEQGSWTIVACDTVAECLGQILGKPADREHARQMLLLLRGREHRVWSGLCLLAYPGTQSRLSVAKTTLRMEPLSDEEIARYVDSGQWEGKAGGFGLQDRPGWLQIVEGSHSNVVGLPMELLAEMLAQE
jgi:septum formation protein